MADARGNFRLGDWLVQPSLNRATRGDQTIHLRAKVMDVLVYLAARPGEVIAKDELLAHVWNGEFVSDSALTRVVTDLRQAFGDDFDRPDLLETIPKRGYRLVAPVGPPEPGVPAARIPARWGGEPRAETRTARLVDEPPISKTSRLRAGVAIVAVVVVLGIGTWALLPDGVGATIAVLPFENLTGDPGREYLAAGLTEETTAVLGQVDPVHLSVIGRTSTLAYRSTPKSVSEIGRELGSDYLLDSSIRSEGDRLRITSKLVRVRDQVLIWSSSFDREPTSILGLERELSMAIAREIRLRLAPGRLDALARRHTQNVHAYDLYLKGRYYWMQFTPATNEIALDHYGRALAIDPNYALAWSGVADVLMGSTINSAAPPQTVSPRAHEAAANAVRHGPELAEAHSSLGHVAFFLDWNWPEAEAAFRKAISLDESYVVGHRMLGHVLSQRGQHAEAKAVLRRARELDPLQPMHHVISAQVAFQARDYAAAAEHARHAIGLGPTFWIAHAQQAQALEQLGQREPALEALSNASRFSGNHVILLGLRGYILAKLHRIDEALETIHTLTTVSETRYVPPTAIAQVYAGLNDRDKVFEWLHRAYEVRDVNLIFLPVDPRWDPYRAESRFTSLLTQAGFAEFAR